LTLRLIFLLILSIPLWGYFILINKKLYPGIFAWFLMLAGNVWIYLLVEASPLLMMLLYIMNTFLSLKILVAHNHLQENEQLNFKQWLVFCYGWFGMNPRPFLEYPSRPLPDYADYIKKGILRIVTGLLIINLAAYFFPAPGNYAFIFHLLYLVSLSLILHFGLLNISTGFLRSKGVNVTSLFKDPIRSGSLNEFWSRRWNLAFVELTTIAVLRPVRSKTGATIAFWTAYVFSGLLHEMAISLPVRTGFGKPFLYFIIQAILILTIDKYFLRVRNAMLRTALILLCLFAPVFLLFHEAFIRKIVIPLVAYLTFV
jgi:alginate O-acetyltransferase complex protein AlgI